MWERTASVFILAGLSLWMHGAAAEEAGEGTWAGPSFREFSGTVQSHMNGPLWDHALSWDRHDLSWAQCEPEPGAWNQEYLDNWGKRVLQAKERGARVLPILDYNAPWSWDRSPRAFEYGRKRWLVAPRKEGAFDVIRFVHRSDGTWAEVERSRKEGGTSFPLAVEQIPAWEAYIRRVVTFLHAPPYNVEYFQIWNEAHPLSGFWVGGLDEFIERAHLPAARVIRECGGKAVYGGYPSCGNLGELIALLDKHDAWGSVDVVATHYHGLSMMEGVRAAASERGFPGLSVWQTEVGFTSNYGYIPNMYPRVLHWALSHGWNRPDRFKLFYFAFWSPDDPKAYGYGNCLNLGSRLSPHGEALQTLGELLGGSPLRLYEDVSSSPPLPFGTPANRSGMEAFEADGRIVVAVHCVYKKEAFPAAISFAFPRLPRRAIVKVDRISAVGKRKSLPDTALTPLNGGPGVRVAVDTHSEGDVEVHEWWGFKGTIRTFYVIITLRPEET